MIDLNNITNLFTIADCHNSTEFKDLKLIKNIKFDDTIQSFLYQHGKDYILTFTPYDYKNAYSYIKTGFEILYNKDLIKVKHGYINNFFNNYSIKFVDSMKTEMTKLKGKLYITGISLGGALGQSFYYNLCNNTNFNRKTFITTFGSPRIGDTNLKLWFLNQTNTKIYNIVLFKKYEIYRKPDPVCLFPGYDNYTNNANLFMLLNNQLVPNADNYIPEDLPKMNIYNLFMNEDISKEWSDIHDIGEYYSQLNTCNSKYI
jgi:hypothetical protein